MRTITYNLMDPAGNRTILVETPVPIEDQPAVAKALMKHEPTAEQVGFLTVPSQEETTVRGRFEASPCDVRLRMAGGEFCGNATMSAAALMAMRSEHAPAQGDSIGVTVQASGASGPLTVALKAETDTVYYGSVLMPKPISIEPAPFSPTGDGRKPAIVLFDGIAHVIMERPAPEGDAARARTEALARSWCDALGAEAIGLLFFERNEMRLTPLIYVPAADTICWESACGSGTTAIGAYLADKAGGPVDVTLKEPGGSLNIVSLEDGTLQMSGTVRYLAWDTVTLDI